MKASVRDIVVTGTEIMNRSHALNKSIHIYMCVCSSYCIFFRGSFNPPLIELNRVISKDRLILDS